MRRGRSVVPYYVYRIPRYGGLEKVDEAAALYPTLF